MLAEIVLPAGTVRVTVRDIPELFANAAQPTIPEDTPRNVVKIKKMPLTEAAKNKWCGLSGRPFPVSLTKDDSAALEQGCWKNLPQLSLPINEADWQPYWEAFQKEPPTDWKLSVMVQDPSLHNSVLQILVAEDWEKIVRQAVLDGKLIPHDPTSLAPRPDAMGEMLLDCIVTVAELTTFAARYDFGVKSAEDVPAFTTSARPSDAPATKTALQGVRMTSLLCIIHGREALPVRAIPHVAGTTFLPPRDLAICFARKQPGPFGKLQSTMAFRVSDNTTVKVLPKEWDEIIVLLEALETRLKREAPSYAEGDAAWMELATPLLPAAVFVWRDEFEKDFHLDIDKVSPTARREGDDVLNYTPMLSESQLSIILEKVQLPVGRTLVSTAPPPIEPLRGSRTPSQKPPTTGKAPDWEFWATMPKVQAWQACALSLNIDPDSMKHSADGWMAGPGHGPFFEPRSFPSQQVADTFGKRLRLLTASITNPAHFRILSRNNSLARYDIDLSDFSTWAVSEMNWDGLPSELVALVIEKQVKGIESAPTSIERFWANAAEWNEYEFLALCAGMNPKKKRTLDSGAFDGVPGYDVQRAKDEERVLFAQRADPICQMLIHKIGYTAYEKNYAGKSMTPANWLSLFDKNDLATAVPSALRIAVSEAVPTETEAPGEANALGSPRAIQSKTAKRSDALTTVIETAKASAQNPSNYHNVWAALVKLAGSQTPPPPLLGFVETEGVKYQGDNDVEFFTKDALRKRMKPSAR